MRPRVTVLMSVYNGQRYLREAIESILNQSFQDFEFLIVNDGSTDRSREIIQSYADPRIRLIDNERNEGLTRSLNRGLKQARGEFVARQDADDISLPERLTCQVAFLEAHPEVVLLGTRYIKIDETGAVLGYRGNRSAPAKCTDIRWALLFYCPFTHSSMVIRKSAVLDDVGLYDESYRCAQDYEYWSRIARSKVVANLSEYLVKYRMSPTSMCATYGESGWNEFFRIVVTNMREVLGSDQPGPIPRSERQYRAMEWLLLGTQFECTADEARAALDAIVCLHDAFCRYYGLNRPQRKAHRTGLFSRNGTALADAANRYVQRGDAAEARRLLVTTCRHSPSLLFRRGQRRLIVKLLWGLLFAWRTDRAVPAAPARQDMSATR